MRVKSATTHGNADKPKHYTRFPPPGGEEISRYATVRRALVPPHAATGQWKILGPKWWVGPSTVPVFPHQSTPTRPPHITKRGVFGASSGPLGWHGLPSREKEAGSTSVRDEQYGAFCAPTNSCRRYLLPYLPILHLLPITINRLGAEPIIRLPLGAPVRAGYHPLHLSPITSNRLGAEHVIRLPLGYH